MNNPHQIEKDMHEGYPNGGYIEDIALPLNGWTRTTGAQLTASTGANAPYRAAVQGRIIGIRWDATVAVGSVCISVEMPGHYDPRIDELQLLVTGRHQGADADADSFSLRATLDHFQPGLIDPTISSTTIPAGTQLTAGEQTVQTIDPTVTTPVNLPTNPWGIAPDAASPTNRFTQRFVPLPVANNTNNPAANFYTVPFNFSLGTSGKLDRGTNDINVVKPGSIVHITLSNSEAVATNNVYDLIGARLRIKRNTSLSRRGARFQRHVLR